jgi:dihydroorotate dehydrogenase
MSLYHTFRPLIFKASPEAAHRVVIALLRIGGSLAPARALLRAWFKPVVNGPPVTAFGIDFPNPIGLAAGFDKDARAVSGLSCLGFGHIEVGTVTPLPQPGNSQPRLFRLVQDEAVINRMGFNNQGAAAMAAQLKRRRLDGAILGVNIGKNKATSGENTIQDYLQLLRTFAPLADYLAINISSPNTPGLRDLQSRALLEGLLKPLAVERETISLALGRAVPLLVKLAPDLDDAQLNDALGVIRDCRMDGVIISNTTLSRQSLTSPKASETGGMSGAPLFERSTAMVSKVVRITQGHLPVVASGGVFHADHARAKLDAGAMLVQVYTGMIYEGPGLVKAILQGLNHPAGS